MDSEAILNTAAICALAVVAYLFLGLLTAKCCSLNHDPEDDEQ